MWNFVLCLFVLTLRYADGSIADEMAETTQLCCNQGTTYARNHSIEDCSSSNPPDVPSIFGTLCIFAMDQCCKEYFTKKIDCESGIDVAKSLKSCGSTRDQAKRCCDQCSSGKVVGKARGASSCSISVQGKSAEQILAGDAFTQCCKEATKDSDARETNRNTATSAKPVEKDLSVLPSICEEYAPNELCAHHCIPIPGSFKCECNPGYMLMADGKNCKEVTKNRCKPHNPCQHKCNDNGIEVKCSCRRGYQLMSDGKSCEDIDECVLDPPVCLPNTQCFNIQGSYKCIPVKHPKNIWEKGQCPPGFARNLQNNACDDINECKLPSPPCPNYLCENTIGGYKCGGVSGDPVNLGHKPRVPAVDRCPPGFKNGLNEECEDVDECITSKDDCNKLSQFCINTRGSFHCQDRGSKHCPAGFKTNAYTNKCEDINECEDGEDICRSDQICVNVLGEYDCKPKKDFRNTISKCPDGMRENPVTKRCDDIDECVEGTHLCDQYQNCLNTNGSHECYCKIGFELDSTTGACIDINECATEQNNCIPESQRCDNTVGSFLCIRLLSCGTGYVIHHSSSTCEDIDECALGTHNCDRAGPQYHCVNIPGSFRCQKKATSTPKPEYEYEYYDVDEEIDEDGNETKTEIITTTTSTPPTPKIETLSTPKLTERTSEESEVTPASDKSDDNFDNTINVEKINEPEKPEPTFPASESTEPIQYPSINEPNKQDQPQEPEIIPTLSTESNKLPVTIAVPTKPEYFPEYPKATETTYSPLPERPTSPKVVVVNVGEETATLRGYKKNYGSTDDASYVPKDKWTVINERPTDCQIGFEMDAYGACFDIDECAMNRHTCSGLTEICRNTMGGYLCECAFGFRRDLPTGGCVLITTSSSTTSTSTTTSTTTTTPPPTTPPPTTPPPTTPPPTTPPPTTPPPTTPPPTTPPPTLPPPTTPPPTTPPPTTPPPTTPPPTTPPPTTPLPTIPVPTTSSTKNYFWGYPDQRTLTSRPFRPRNICDVGYLINYKTGKCEDINECTNGQANCGSVEICINTEGGYRCECQPNWRLDPDRHKCVPVWIKGRFPPGYGNVPDYPRVDPNDIIPGTTGLKKIVNPNITNINDIGSIFNCPWGTRLSDGKTCEDIDECATGEAQCGPLQICTNLAGGYTCSCPVGHRLIGDHLCEDVNECALGGSVPVCSQHADCVNTIGSYQCHCHEGFKSAPVNDKVCIDVDECMESRTGSLCEQRCNNVWGSYRCACHRGYRLNRDNRTCSDIDECTEFKHKTLCIGRCINEPGSYRCSCPPGYRLSNDKRSCIDIDECETGVAPCSSGTKYEGASDVCLNTRGGYRCHRITCPSGYQLENKHRCSVIQTYCSPSDWECTHKPSTYSYNFFTFVSNLYIPESKVDLFTMRGPAWSYARMRFQLRVVDVDAPPSVVNKADINAFTLNQNLNQAVVSLVRPLEGPQSIELELSMELYSREQFGGTAVAKLYIYVSEYEF